MQEKEVGEITQICDGLLNGKVPEELVLTPRGRNEKRLFWENTARIQKRRKARETFYDSKIARKEFLLKKVDVLREKAARKNQLPPLHFSILRNSQVSEFGLDHEQNVAHGMVNKECPPYGWSALHIAVQNGQREVTEALLAIEAIELDRIDNAGYTALHYAFMSEQFPLGELLLESGANPLAKNREGHTPFDVALSLGFRKQAEEILDKIDLNQLIRWHARSFFDRMFEGDPSYYHYKVAEYYNKLLVAYVLCYHPKAFAKKRFHPKLTNLNLFTTANWDDGEIDDAYLTREKRRREAAAQNAKHLQRVDHNPQTKNQEFTFQGYKLFRFVPQTKLRKWIKASKKWKFHDSAKAHERISEHVFHGAMSAKEVHDKLRQGVELFERWKQNHEEELLQEARNRLRAIADALRLERMKNERELKAKLEKARHDKEQEQEKKRGGNMVDRNAGVKITCESNDENRVYYSADNTDPALYTIVLQTKPIGTVLIKFNVIAPEDHEGEPRFVTTPKLASFTPKNWDVPQQIQIDIRNDDAVVRLKRDVAIKPKGACDHIIENVIQSTTDWSYKYEGLKWTPSNQVRVHVTE